MEKGRGRRKGWGGRGKGRAECGKGRVDGRAGQEGWGGLGKAGVDLGRPGQTGEGQGGREGRTGGWTQMDDVVDMNCYLLGN